VQGGCGEKAVNHRQWRSAGRQASGKASPTIGYSAIDRQNATGKAQRQIAVKPCLLALEPRSEVYLVLVN
jgi:hypothetical protein